MKTGYDIKKKLRRRSTFNFSVVLVFPIIIIGICFVFIYYTSYEPAWSYNWKLIRQEIQDSLMIADKCGITSGVGGNGISTQRELDRRIWIMNHASIEELFWLTKHPSGVIKALAYEGLLRHKDFEDKKALVLDALKDTETHIYYQYGCISSKITVGSYLVREVLMIDNKWPPHPPNSICKFGLSDLDKEHILKKFYINLVAEQ